ncbi:MAG: hypothetical protein MRY83_05195 [Flavobacteriales bacterium]|nr:hypothetical protein [Flavobacteriales bacterium]
MQSGNRSIVGLLFFEAKQEGLKPSFNISQLAEAEFKVHRAEAKPLAQKLDIQYSLSKNAATECAKNILRYQTGAKPINTQMTTMADIARQIEEKYPDSLEKDLGSHNLVYLRRMNADSMFKESVMRTGIPLPMNRICSKYKSKPYSKFKNKT